MQRACKSDTTIRYGAEQRHANEEQRARVGVFVAVPTNDQDKKNAKR